MAELNKKNANEKLVAVISQIWYRARINSFAHKVANEEFKKKGTKHYKWTIIFALLSVLFIILLYIYNQNSIDNLIFSNLISITITFASIAFTITSLYFTIMSNHGRFEIRAAEHKFLLNSYQYIAQRAREANWPDKPDTETIELLKDLERDFALLKARGNEPLDDHFDKAHEIIKKIRADSSASVAQSFDFENISSASANPSQSPNDEKGEHST